MKIAKGQEGKGELSYLQSCKRRRVYQGKSQPSDGVLPPREGSSLAMPCRGHGPLLTTASAPSRLVLQYPVPAAGRGCDDSARVCTAVRGFAIESGMFKHFVPE